MSQVVRLIDTVLPPRCVGCGQIVGQQGAVCASCFHQLRFLTGSVCRTCAMPLDAVAAVESQCDQCHKKDPPWEKATAALAYEGKARQLILRFKHQEKSEYAGVLAGWMASAATTYKDSDFIVIPVPIHRWRLLKRGFNQSSLLAEQFAKRLGLICHHHVFKRVRHTASQQGLSEKERKANLQSSVFEGDPAVLHAKRVLLVDDVLTTGATLQAATTSLLDAGALEVHLMILARVVGRDKKNHIE